MSQQGKARSNSVGAGVPLAKRLAYLAYLAKMNVARGGRANVVNIVDSINDIADTYERHTGRKSSVSSVLEIGFGGRPHRAFALQLRFDKVTAVDLDSPVFGWRDFLSALRSNGLLPSVKALIRSEVFDRGEWAHFHSSLKELDQRYSPDRSHLVVADVGGDEFWQRNPGPYDLVYSVDVFEHIPEENLIRAMKQIRDQLAPNGLVVTVPCVFTGIVGGHDAHWYPHRVDSNSSETAWGHVLEKESNVDTYLNRLTRRRYIEIYIDCGFEVIEDTALRGRFGEKHLTSERRQHLPDVLDDYELFSNNVRFVLRPRD